MQGVWSYLWSLTGYPLVDGRRPTVEEPLDHQPRGGAEVGGSQRVLAVQDGGLTGAVADFFRHEQMCDLHSTYT